MIPIFGNRHEPNPPSCPARSRSNRRVFLHGDPRRRYNVLLEPVSLRLPPGRRCACEALSHGSLPRCQRRAPKRVGRGFRRLAAHREAGREAVPGGRPGRLRPTAPGTRAHGHRRRHRDAGRGDACAGHERAGGGQAARHLTEHVQREPARGRHRQARGARPEPARGRGPQRA